MARGPKSNVAVNGRSFNPKGGRFSRLPHEVQNSPAYRALTPNARAVLIELISLESGENNGLLYLSERDAADRIGVRSEKTSRQAFCELAETGLIVCTGNAHFNIKTGDARARRWALTWLFDYANRRSACHLWRSYRPDGVAMTRVASGMKSVKRYRKIQPLNDDEELNHAGKFYRFDPQYRQYGANHPPVNSTGSNDEAAENRHLCDRDPPVNITDYTAVTRGTVLPARWEERPRSGGGRPRQYLLVA